MREGDAAEVVGNGAADGGCSRKAGREGGHVERGGVGWRGAEAIVTRGLYTCDRNEDRKKTTTTIPKTTTSMTTPVQVIKL